MKSVDLTSKINIVLSILLIVYLIYIFYWVEKSAFITIDQISLTIIIFFSIFWFFFKKKHLRFVLSLLAIFIFLYFYTINLEVIKGYKLIDSRIYINPSYNMTFWYSDSYILFDSDYTYLEYRLHFGVDKLENKSVPVILILYPPENVYYYEINLTENIRIGEGKTIELILEKSLLDNMSINKRIEINEHSTLDIRILYYMPRMDPLVNIRFYLQSQNNQPKIQNVFSGVSFIALKYECIEPCIRIFTENVTLEHETRHIFNTTYGGEKAFTHYNIRGNDINELNFGIRVLNKEIIIIRTLIISIIAGLIVASINTIINQRNNYDSSINNAKMRISNIIRKIESLVHTLVAGFSSERCCDI